MKRIVRQNKMRYRKRFGAVLLAFVMLATTVAVLTTTAEAQIVTGSGYSWLNSYRGNDSNMAVIEDSAVAAGIPTGTDNANVKWSTSVGGGWSNATTGGTFLDGKLYVLGGGILKQIDTTTGEVVNAASVTSNNKYNYFLTNGDVNGTKMIFVQAGLTVMAYDAQLQHLWTSEPTMAGNQGLCQLYYQDGVIYGATVNTKKNTAATYFAMSALDGSYLWQQEAPILTTSYNGSYWAGGVVVGKYVVFGGEGARVTVYDKTNGDIVSVYDCFPEYNYNIRSAMTYSNGYLYFTTTNGFVWKLGIDSESGQLQDVISNQITPNATTTITTPTIYNGRLYVGCTTNVGAKGAIGVLDAENLSQIYSIDLATGGGKVMDIALVKDPSSEVVYGYSTYYTKPGSVICFTDSPEQTEASYTDFGTITSDINAQYCVSQVMVGSDGCIYFTNDSGKITAIEKNEAYLTSLSTDKGSLKEAFRLSSTSYEVVVPVGTTQATISYGIPQGASLAVDGTIQAGGKIQCDLSKGAYQHQLTVSKGTQSRSYQLVVREVSTDTGIKVLTTTGNGITAGTQNWSANGSGMYTISGINQPRVWYTAEDANATLSSMDFTETKDGQSYSTSTMTSSNVYQNEAYAKRVYFSKTKSDTTSYTMGKVTVTAEDGVTTKDYYFIVTGTIPATIEPEENIATEITIKNADETEPVTAVTVNATQNDGTLNLTDLFQIDITHLNDDTDSTENEIQWTSSDPSVATVVKREVPVVSKSRMMSAARILDPSLLDANAKATAVETKTEYILKAVGNGTATITASCGYANTSFDVAVSGVVEDEEAGTTDSADTDNSDIPSDTADTNNTSTTEPTNQTLQAEDTNVIAATASKQISQENNTDMEAAEEAFDTAALTDATKTRTVMDDATDDIQIIEEPTPASANMTAVAVASLCGCIAIGGVGYLFATRKKKTK